MSSRILRRLREEQEQQKKEETDEDTDEYSNDDETMKSNGLFTLLDSSEEDDEEDESEEEDDESVEQSKNYIREDCDKIEKEEEEDFDAILSEFQIVSNAEDERERTTCNRSTRNIHSILLENINISNFDLDSTLQAVMHGTSTISASKKKFVKNLFYPNIGTNIKPPHFNGGGMGMEKIPLKVNDMNSKISLCSNLLEENVVFYRFMYSDIYERLEEQYETIQTTGDVNLLALFVADNPFHAKSLLQLSTVCYKTGSADKGKELLQRCLYLYQCSSIHSFFPIKDTCNIALMDFSLKENQDFFIALFRYMQCASKVGCIPTALVIAKFLFSLDPLFDPMGVLLVFDYYALAMNSSECNDLVIELIESKLVSILHLDTKNSLSNESSSSSVKRCSLSSMPNWAYNYALALHRLNNDSSSKTTSNKDDIAIKDAIRAYPSVVSLLLEKNNIDTKSKTASFDLSVLPELNRCFSKEEETKLACTPVLSKIIDIFVTKNSPLWSSQDVLLWLHRNCLQLVAENQNKEIDASSKNHFTIDALERYNSCDVNDYTNQVTTLPAELNLLDERLVAPALALDPNRRRLLPQHGAAAVQQQDRNQWLFPNNHRQQDHYNRIDLDDPMLEIFLRSLLPWNSAQR